MIQVGDKVRVRRLKDLACEHMNIERYKLIGSGTGSECIALIDKGSFFIDSMCVFLWAGARNKFAPFSI